MNIKKFIPSILLGALVFGTIACKDQLDVGNPNSPSVTVNSEAGLVSLAQGGVYIAGFSNGDGWLGDSYFSLPWGYNELMADLIGADASNNQITTIGVPDYLILDNGTKIENTSSSSIGIIRSYNTRAATGAGNNAIYYQWLNMYALNNACNVTLASIDKLELSPSKVATYQAWCYWWKAYAYASIGSMYYSGLIMDEVDPGKPTNTLVSSEYVSHDKVIDRSNYYFKLAITTLNSITSASEYSGVLGSLIPSFNQTGNGGVLTQAMWIRNINTMLARNILLNKLSPFVKGNPDASISGSSTSTMSIGDWNDVVNYATDGIKEGDKIFTGRTVKSNGFFSTNGGSVAALSTSVNTSSTFKVGERFIQNFKTGDKRFIQNFKTGTTYKNNYTFTTRYNVIERFDPENKESAGDADVYAYASQIEGKYELVIAGSYEENALMLAEAKIRLGNIDAGLSYIDAVRSYMGAGLSPVVGTLLTKADALKELISERRVSLVFRGLSFYDSRRWGWIYDISKGGGSYGNTVYYNTNGVLVLNTNVTINYNFMDYWDVPADETELNGKTVVKNPNF